MLSRQSILYRISKTETKEEKKVTKPGNLRNQTTFVNTIRPQKRKLFEMNILPLAMPPKVQKD